MKFLLGYNSQWRFWCFDENDEFRRLNFDYIDYEVGKLYNKPRYAVSYCFVNTNIFYHVLKGK